MAFIRSNWQCNIWKAVYFCVLPAPENRIDLKRLILRKKNYFSENPPPDVKSAILEQRIEAGPRHLEERKECRNNVRVHPLRLSLPNACDFRHCAEETFPPVNRHEFHNSHSQTALHMCRTVRIRFPTTEPKSSSLTSEIS